MRPHSLQRATAAWVAVSTAHVTLVFYFAPVVLAAMGQPGNEALVFGGSAVATLVAVLPAARLSDRHPRRRVMAQGIALTALGYVALAAAPFQLAALVGAGVAVGVGHAMTVIPFNSYVADCLAEAATMGRGYGRTSAASVLVSALGPLSAAGVFAVAATQTLALQLNAALFAGLCVAGIVLLRGLPSQRHEGSAPTLTSSPSEPSIVPAVATLYFLLGMGTGLAAPYFAIYFLGPLQLTGSQWGLVLTLGTVAGALGFYVSGHWGPGFGSRKTIQTALALNLVASLVFVFPLPVVAFVLAYVGRTMFTNMVIPMTNSALMSRAGAGVRGRTLGWTTLAWMSGWSIGAIAGAPLLADHGGSVFAVAGVLGALGGLAGHTVMKRGLLRPRPEPAAPTDASA